MAEFNDFSRSILKALRGAIDDAVGEAADYGVTLVKAQFSSALALPGPPTRDGTAPERLGIPVKKQPPSPAGTAPYSKTGLLRRSITAKRQSSGKWIVGTNVKYAAVHELGLRVQRKGHNRRLKVKVKLKSGKKQTRRRVVFVKPHTAKFPKRPFLVVGLVGNKTKIQQYIDRNAAGIFQRRLRGAA